jgi:hypothetical protein
MSLYEFGWGRSISKFYHLASCDQEYDEHMYATLLALTKLTSRMQRA